LEDEQQRDEIASPNPPMHERIDRSPMPRRVERADERRGLRAHDRQQRFDGIENAGDATESQRGSAETDDLTIIRRRVAPDDVNRVGGSLRMIERAI
jgi:hypothetical protein